MAKQGSKVAQVVGVVQVVRKIAAMQRVRDGEEDGAREGTGGVRVRARVCVCMCVCVCVCVCATLLLLMVFTGFFPAPFLLLLSIFYRSIALPRHAGWV